MKSYPLELENFSATLFNRTLFNIDSFIPVPGTSTAITGMTGTGKSVLLTALAGLLPSNPFKLTGSMKLHGFDAYKAGIRTDYKTWSKIRKKGLVFIPAESAQAMNPSLSLEQNLNLLAPDSRDLIEQRLNKYFGIDFQKFTKYYPDEVSGGELQRITLMILLSRQGGLLFLDEPTVNLDRNLRVRFIEFLNNEILTQKDKTILMASHDIDFVRALSMDAIIALEDGILKHLDALPESTGYDKPNLKEATGSGLELQKVSQHYKIRGLFGEHDFYAFRNLNMTFSKSRVYGISGPSGCGKTSMIRAILRLIDGTSGNIILNKQNLVELKQKENGNDPAVFKPFRNKMTVVQQDSRFAFFPDLKIKDSFSQINSQYNFGDEYDRNLLGTYMNKLCLPLGLLDKLPRSLSSGEMKRMDIVRSLISKPKVLLLDEPFAHIDFETRTLVMRAISEYLAENQVVLLVVTHEDFDLKYFIDENFDFLSIAKNKQRITPRK
jgi:peptide/nickel transport system ATP-binding protein